MNQEPAHTDKRISINNYFPLFGSASGVLFVLWFLGFALGIFALADNPKYILYAKFLLYISTPILLISILMAYYRKKFWQVTIESTEISFTQKGMRLLSDDVPYHSDLSNISEVYATFIPLTPRRMLKGRFLEKILFILNPGIIILVFSMCLVKAFFACLFHFNYCAHNNFHVVFKDNTRLSVTLPHATDLQAFTSAILPFVPGGKIPRVFYLMPY